MDTTQQEIATRQALAQALLQKGMSGGPQGQMISGHYVGPGLGALVPFAQVVAGQKIGQEANTQAKSYEDTQREALRNDLAKFLTTHRGTPGEAMGPPTEEGGMGVTGAVPADPQAAILGAMTSRHPEMQKIGQSQLATLFGPKTPEHFGNPVTERGANGDLISVQYGNLGNRRVVPGAVPFEKPMAVADRVIDPAKPTAPLADYSTKGGETKTVNGDLYQVDSNGKWHKLDNAPKVNVSSNVRVEGQKQGLVEWSKLAAKTVSDMADQARGSVRMMGTLNQLERLDQSGVFTGPTSGAAEFVTNLGQSLGVKVDSNKLANSQTYASAAQEAVQGIIAGMGGNRSVTEKEAVQITKMAPSLLQSPQGRQQLTAYLRQIAQRQITEAQQAQKEYSAALQTDNPGAFTFGLSSAQLPMTNPLPPAQGAASPAGGQPMSLDDYLKSRGGR